MIFPIFISLLLVVLVIFFAVFPLQGAWFKWSKSKTTTPSATKEVIVDDIEVVFDDPEL